MQSDLTNEQVNRLRGASLLRKRGKIVRDRCPQCTTPLTAKWSGVECPAPGCGYWFCY